MSELFLLVCGSPSGVVRCGKEPSLVRRLKISFKKISFESREFYPIHVFHFSQSAGTKEASFHYVDDGLYRVSHQNRLVQVITRSLLHKKNRL